MLQVAKKFIRKVQITEMSQGAHFKLMTGLNDALNALDGLLMSMPAMPEEGGDRIAFDAAEALKHINNARRIAQSLPVRKTS